MLFSLILRLPLFSRASPSRRSLFKTDFDYAKFLSTGGHAGIQGKIAGMKDPYADEVKEKKSKKNN